MIQFTKAKATIGSLGSITIEDGNKIFLSIEPDEVKVLDDHGSFRRLTYICTAHKMEVKDEANVAIGTLFSIDLTDECGYILSAIGIRGIIGS